MEHNYPSNSLIILLRLPAGKANTTCTLTDTDIGLDPVRTCVCIRQSEKGDDQDNRYFVSPVNGDHDTQVYRTGISNMYIVLPYR